MQRPESAPLTGLERKLVFNRLRAWLGLRWELPQLLGPLVIPPRGLCLEIGTGYGWGTLGLLGRAEPSQAGSARVVAVDYDRTVLPATRAFLGQHGVAPRVAFCQADAKCLPFPDGSFDVVLAVYVLHHVGGYRQAVREIGRVTKPGGRFLFIDVVRHPWMPHYWGRLAPDGLASQTELRGFLAEAGFRLERWRALPVWLWLLPTVWATAHKAGPARPP